MTEFEIGPDGERVSTRYAQDYFAMMRDFARHGRLHGAYGKSIVTRSALWPEFTAPLGFGYEPLGNNFELHFSMQMR